MSAIVETLPLVETRVPRDAAELSATIAEAAASATAVYPIGGGTSLDYGVAPTRPGIGLSLKGMNRVLDYPARDMTITAEAGLTILALRKTLADQRQWLPIDAPQNERATLGGSIATAFSGPRRYGWGTLRDYVIGISAVDGRGELFKAGGQVVKNVAGYDFCKLLIGSLGTLGVITQVTLKIKPMPEQSAFLVAEVSDLEMAERLLSALVTSQVTPAAIELLIGPAWRDHEVLGLLPAGANGRLAVGLEGSAVEVRWMLDQLAAEWRAQGVSQERSIAGGAAISLWYKLAEFPAAAAPLVIKASVPASHTTRFAALVQAIDPRASIQAHAGNGIIIARFARFEQADISASLVGRLQPAAEAVGGHLVVLSSTLDGLTRQAIWGGATDATSWMAKVKRQFDPRDILNPGRFVY